MNTKEEVIIDLMECAKKKIKPPKGKKYRFKVKKQMFVVDVESMTGRQICVLASLNPPENYKLSMKIKGGFKEIMLDEVVSFLEPGIEKFTYIRKDPTEG